MAKEITMLQFQPTAWAAPLTLTLALASPLAALAQGNPAVTDDVDRGRQLFMSNGCYSCHGTVGQGGERSGAPKLAPEPYPFEAFRALVRTPREAMPRLDQKFVSDEQLQLIHRYLASIVKGPAAKDIPALRF
jgi:ubiquinol-cytochrome c reductase cytochrome c subunit